MDGRVLRALLSRQLVEERGDRVHPTAIARSACANGAGAAEDGKRANTALSLPQQELLRMLSLNSAPASEDALDGRSLRALLARGFARRTSRGIEITGAGAEARRQLGNVQNDSGRSDRRSRREHPRAAAILRAVAILERVVPRDSELAVGDMFVHVDDLLYGFRRYARKLK
jgi:hypothetical protein